MKAKSKKRELIGPRGDKRYIRCDAKGRIKESDDVGRSLSQDRRRKTKTVAKPGQGDRGDRKLRGQRPRNGQPRVPNANREADLFGADHLPEGFSYAASLLDEAEEQALLAEIRALPFRDFEFHGFVGKRRIVSFGWRYDFNGGGLSKTGAPHDALPGKCPSARMLAG